MTSPATGGGSPIRTAQLVSLLLLVVLVGLLASQTLGSDDEATSEPTAPGLRGSVLPRSLLGADAPTFRLADARGGSLSSAALAGRPYAVTFLFTQCPDVCPVIGQEIKQALARMGPRASEVTVAAISVDPKGDTREAVQKWLDRQRLPQNFRYAIGSKEELQPVWRAYFAAPQIEGRPESSTHTASIWLVDRRGRLRAKYSAGTPIDPADLAADLLKLAGPRQRST